MGKIGRLKLIEQMRYFSNYARKFVAEGQTRSAKWYATEAYHYGILLMREYGKYKNVPNT